MKNYMDAVRAAGIGRTPQLCQDALIETLEELFAGKKYNGQQSRKELKIFKQDLPVPEDYDADVDTDAAAAPYIVVRMTGGEIKNDDGPQAVEFSLIVCAYDEGKEREGYRFGRGYTLLRKRNMVRLKHSLSACRRAMRRHHAIKPALAQGLLSRLGQMKHCNHVHFFQSYVEAGLQRKLKCVVREHARKERARWNTSTEQALSAA